MARIREPKRYDRNFRRLLAGAAKVFYEKGYERATLRDIARETGMSLAGIYYYTSGKEEILFHIQKRCFLEVQESLRTRLSRATSPEEKLRALVENHLEFFVSNMREMKVLSHEGDALAGGYHKEIAALKRDYVREARAIIEEIQTRSGARGLDPGVAALSLFGMMNWIYTWHDPKRDGGARALARAMLRIFLQGLAPARRRN